MWKCSNCSEHIEDDLDVCWNCQIARDGSSSEDYFSTSVPKGLEGLQERMAGQSNKGLLRIINVDFKDYREDAIELARAELNKRGLPQPQKPTEQTEKSAKGKTNQESHQPTTTRKLCSDCAAALDDDARFCPDCRAPVSAEGMIGCPACKKSISASSQFCKYCGAVLISHKDSNRNSKSSASRFIPLKPKSAAASGNLIAFGAIIATVSILAYLWGINYAGNFGNMMSSGLSKMAGRKDPAYDLAVLAVNFSPLSFLGGLIMFVAGLVLKHK